MPVAINPKDRHVVGAALIAAAPVLVSNDRRLRDEVDASGLQLTALDLDTFAIELWRSSPNDVHAVIDTMVSKRQRPPISTDELIGALHRYMPSLAVAVQAS